MINKTFVKYLVRAAALYNASALVIFLVPGGLNLFGVRLPYSPFWLVLPALLALFGSIVLFLSSRNLDKYGAFPYWNGLVRCLFAAVAFALDFGGTVGLFIGLIALGDLLLGLLCIVTLPIGLKRTHAQLLLDK